MAQLAELKVEANRGTTSKKINSEKKTGKPNEKIKLKTIMKKRWEEKSCAGQEKNHQDTRVMWKATALTTLWLARTNTGNIENVEIAVSIFRCGLLLTLLSVIDTNITLTSKAGGKGEDLTRPTSKYGRWPPFYYWYGIAKSGANWTSRAPLTRRTDHTFLIQHQSTLTLSNELILPIFLSSFYVIVIDF